MTNDGTANRGVVVIGAGQAAAQLAISLRNGGYKAPIIFIGDEPFVPYQRPPLSKKFLTERPAPDTLFLRPAAFWTDKDVTLKLGVAAKAVDLKRRAVTLANGQEVGFDILVFATGTRARALPLPGVTLDGVFSLRSIGDVQRLRPALDDARRVAILGGGYIGLETAAVMREEGRDAMVLEAEERVLKRVTAPAVAAFFDRVHREHGVDIRCGLRVAGILGEDRASALKLADGSTVEADAILLAAGAAANDDLARATGLACQDGIVVDATAKTSAENVYAIGDCARFPSGRYGRQLRLECVQNAIEQAKAAAEAILGTPEPYDPVPWFWSDQYDIKLQIAGLFDGHDTATMVGDPGAGHFAVEYHAGGKLFAVDAVNEPRAHMMARRRIAADTAADHGSPRGEASPQAGPISARSMQ
jgi:3-phenylpropionate/trans-cinnamate dioxygenase ferredoxin reductase component